MASVLRRTLSPSAPQKTHSEPGKMVEYHDVGRQRAGMRERFPEIVHLVLAELEIDNIAAYWDILEVGAHNIHGSVHAPRRPFARKVIKAAKILPKLSVIDSHG